MMGHNEERFGIDQGPGFSIYMRSCRSGNKKNVKQGNRKSSNAERSRDKVKTYSTKMNRARYNRHSSSSLDGSPQGKKQTDKPDKISKKSYYRPTILMSSTSINAFIKQKELKLARTRGQTKLLKKFANSGLSKKPRTGRKMTDQDIHQLPCGESGKWKYIRMYQERARRRKSRSRRKRQKEREESGGKRRRSGKKRKTGKRRKSRSRKRTGKKRKTGKRRKSRSRKRSLKSKTRRKSPKSRRRRRRSKSRR